MSIRGFKTALAYGEKLKKFKDADAAERYFLARKDKLLKKFEKNCAKHSLFLPDYSVESLKKLEKLYFDLCGTGGLPPYSLPNMAELMYNQGRDRNQQ